MATVEEAVGKVLQNPKALNALVKNKDSSEEEIKEILGTYGINLEDTALADFKARLRIGKLDGFKAENLLEHYDWLASPTKEGTLPPSWRT